MSAGVLQAPSRGDFAATLAQKEREISVAAPSWALVGTAVVLVVGFFLAGHDWNVSRTVAYTQTAEEMELSASGGNALRRLAFVAVAAWGIVLFGASKRPIAFDPVLGTSLALLVALTGVSFSALPKGFIPNQDKGYLVVEARLPDGASLQRTA